MALGPLQESHEPADRSLFRIHYKETTVQARKPAYVVHSRKTSSTEAANQLQDKEHRAHSRELRTERLRLHFVFKKNDPFLRHAVGKYLNVLVYRIETNCHTTQQHMAGKS